MIPKEMAKDLYNKFYNTNNHPNSVDIRHNAAKENSLICIRYVIDQSRQQYESDLVHFYETEQFEYYKMVIAEIEKL